MISSTKVNKTNLTNGTPNDFDKKKSGSFIQFAKFEMLNNAIFEGEVDSEGKPNGKGKLTLINGDYYEGEFSKGLFEGSGVLNKISEGAIYKGEFKGNLRHGNGIQTWKDGRKFDGQFEDDMRTGYGRLVINRLFYIF